MGVTVADARFMKPLDVELIRRLAREHDAMLTVEENAVGGFGAHVLHFMVLDGLMDDVSSVFFFSIQIMVVAGVVNDVSFSFYVHFMVLGGLMDYEELLFIFL